MAEERENQQAGHQSGTDVEWDSTPSEGRRRGSGRGSS